MEQASGFCRVAILSSFVSLFSKGTEINSKTFIVIHEDYFLKSFAYFTNAPIFALPITNGRFVYRLGHLPFTEERRVRFPYGLPKRNDLYKEGLFRYFLFQKALPHLHCRKILYSFWWFDMCYCQSYR